MVLSALRHAALVIVILLMSSASPMAQNQAVSTWREFIRERHDIAALKDQKRRKILDKLGAAIKADPAGVSDEIETSRGAAALCQYVRLMFAADRAPEVIDQLDAVLHGGEPGKPIGEMLNAASFEDGSTWFPRAKRAGYFTGCVVGALDGRRKSGFASIGKRSSPFREGSPPAIARRIAERLKIEPPSGGDGFGKWILDALSRKQLASPAALDWFELGFDGSY